MQYLKRLVKTLFSRFVIVSLLIIIQITLLVMIMLYLDDFSRYIHIAFTVISYLLVFFLINRNEQAVYKIPWLVLILAFPVPGTIGYVLFGSQVLPSRKAKKLQMVKNRLLEDMPKDDMAAQKLKEENLLAYGQTNYIL